MENPSDNALFEKFDEYAEESRERISETDSQSVQYSDDRFLQNRMHELDINALRQLPIYLNDLLLSDKVPAPLLCREHYSYWAWTAAIAGAFDRESLYMIDMSSPLPDVFKDYRKRLKEYFILCNSLLFPIREKGMDGRIQAFFTTMNPNVEGLNFRFMISSAGTLGFSILDGLLTEHVKRINSDGNLAGRSSINAPWRDDGTATNPPNIRDKLELWKTGGVCSQQTKSTLETLDSLTRDGYNFDKLKKLPIFPNQEWNSLPNNSKRRDSFFWVLKEHRNENIHGLESPQLAGPIVLNLCCLVIWDTIKTKAYQAMVETLKDEISSANVTANTRSSNRIIGGDFDREDMMTAFDGYPFWKHPNTFYPLYSDESYSEGF